MLDIIFENQYINIQNKNLSTPDLQKSLISNYFLMSLLDKERATKRKVNDNALAVEEFPSYSSSSFPFNWSEKFSLTFQQLCSHCYKIS